MSKAINWVLFIVGLVMIIKFFAPSYTHRYEMTFNVQVGDDIRSGSSVVQVTWQKQPDAFGSWSSSTKGQAALIDLGDKGILLMALGGSGEPTVPSSQMLAFKAYRDSGLVTMKPNAFANNLKMLAQPMERLPLQPNNRPQFIWLSDRNDSATARPVKAEEFSAVIAPDVVFQDAWVQTTRKSITKDLAEKLPWLPKFAEPRIVLEHPNRFTLVSALLTQGISL